MASTAPPTVPPLCSALVASARRERADGELPRWTTCRQLRQRVAVVAWVSNSSPQRGQEIVMQTASLRWRRGGRRQARLLCASGDRGRLPPSRRAARTGYPTDGPRCPRPAGVPGLAHGFGCAGRARNSPGQDGPLHVSPGSRPTIVAAKGTRCRNSRSTMRLGPSAAADCLPSGSHRMTTGAPRARRSG